jgi:hypothetical protein
MVKCQSSADWRGMRLCAEGIEDCEGGGLCRRYGWTGRRTARVAHKRAGRRLRLQDDLERLPMLQRPLRSLRSGGCPGGGDTKRRIWRPAGRCIWMFLSTPCPSRPPRTLFSPISCEFGGDVHGRVVCCERGAAQAALVGRTTALWQTSRPTDQDPGSNTLAPWAFGKLAGRIAA